MRKRTQQGDEERKEDELGEFSGKLYRGGRWRLTDPRTTSFLAKKRKKTRSRWKSLKRGSVETERAFFLAPGKRERVLAQ